MRTLVQFRVCGADYCVPVEATRAVRSADGMIELPAPRPHVAGLLPGDPPLIVMSPFGPDGHHIIVLQVDDELCGLLVEEVTGLRRVDEAHVRAAPRGQDREFISGSVTIDGQLVLLADPSAVAVGL
jgi:chemotaxis signal transduction protein